MLDIMERRVTRSISNELQARAAQAQAQQSGSNSYMAQNSYQMHVHHHQQQQQQLHSGGQQQHQYPPSNSGMNQHHYQQQQQQQQQAVMGISNMGGMGGNSMAGVSLATYPRTMSEEMFLNTLMNTPLSPGTPTMEAGSLGFMDSLHPPQTQRGNSEELFNSWIATSAPESSNQYQSNVHSGPSPTGNRPRQNTRRVSSELQAIISQQNGWAPRTDNEEQLPQSQTNSYLSDDVMSNVNSDPKPYREHPAGDKSGFSDFDKAGSLKDMWLSSNSPMTRSRSSELRRKFAKLEGLSTTPSADVFQRLATQGTLEGLVNHQPMSSGGTFGPGPIGNNERHDRDENSRPMGGPQAPQVAAICSSAPVNHKQQIQQQPPAAANSGLSGVVGLLKGSLERKKMQTKQQQESQQGTRSRSQEPLQPGVRSRSSQEPPQPGARNRSTQEPPQPGVMGMPTPVSSAQISGHRQDDSLNRSQDHMQHIHNDNGPVQSGQLHQQNSQGRAHSPDESSCGVLSHSTGMANSDGPSTSAVSVHRQALKHGSGAVVDQPSPKRQAFSGIDSGGPSNRETCDNGATKTSSLQKPDQLARANSVTSSLRTGFKLNEIDGATRKRRVERQRKMAEAKGRGNVPPMPADMQAVVKRCDALEKEVRSLKLNLSFMNRKDSEQTKKIEELEQHNQDLKEERERLLEELDRVSPTDDPQ